MRAHALWAPLVRCRCRGPPSRTGQVRPAVHAQRLNVGTLVGRQGRHRGGNRKSLCIKTTQIVERLYMAPGTRQCLCACVRVCVCVCAWEREQRTS
jgi:hypothetical protein